MKIITTYQHTDRDVTNLIDKLVRISYDLAAEKNITLEDASAIVRAELERALKRNRPSD